MLASRYKESQDNQKHALAENSQYVCRSKGSSRTSMNAHDPLGNKVYPQVENK